MLGGLPYLQRLGCLKNKLNKIKYELERVLISKNSKKIGFILIRRISGRAEHLGQSTLGKRQSALVMCRLTLAMCQLTLQECRQAFLGAKHPFQFWFNMDSFFKDFLARNCT